MRVVLDFVAVNFVQVELKWIKRIQQEKLSIA
ncbi:unnamed protein product [Acanthoscelides obtectus]|uniref:Uncharacterized protein n=1 Tax=Acanthoscelides obtectus TaxID=200917 RepID=A0A9P0JNJ9_ACAOB|nr:unnamed protein product [Acanthoscelides obtectus]CAK1678701.1 hypothetical protein AOBTE_LOCUS32005 [Acanthoscelides obtectus]